MICNVLCDTKQGNFLHAIIVIIYAISSFDMLFESSQLHTSNCKAFGWGKKSLGTFEKPEDAAMAYDRVAVSCLGRDAMTNFPLTMYKEELIQHANTVMMERRNNNGVAPVDGRGGANVRPRHVLNVARMKAGKYRGILRTGPRKWQAQIR